MQFVWSTNFDDNDDRDDDKSLRDYPQGQITNERKVFIIRFYWRKTRSR